MNADEAPSRFPNLSQLTIALIENAVKPILGDRAIDVLSTPYKQRETIQKLNNVLVAAEHQFQSECRDVELREGLMQLKISDLPSLQKAFWSFYKSPGESGFLDLLKRTLRSQFINISMERIDGAAKIYLRILYRELLSLDQETREKLLVLNTLEIKDGVDRIANGVEKIVGLLDAQNAIKQDGVSEELDVCIVFAGKHQEDKKLAMIIAKSLQNRTVVVRDFNQDISLGRMEGILLDIKRCRNLIQLISEDLAYSEMVVSILRHAFNNNIRIIPIRVNYLGKLLNPLSYFIPNEKFIHWENENDNTKIVDEISKAINGQPYGLSAIDVWRAEESAALSRPYPAANVGDKDVYLEHPKGTMDPDSRFYISRPEDYVMQNEMGQSRFIITIKGPRQMGKSSMLIRGCESLVNSRRKVVYIDFQRFGKTLLNDTNMFYKVFCEVLADKLNINTDLDSYWKTMRFNAQMRCSNFIEKFLLPEVDAGVILAMDEVDMMIDTKGKSDFFGLLRSWYNEKSPLWRKFNMVLAVSTEPLMFIDQEQSPFNIGTVLKLDDFTESQVWKLNELHNFPFTDNDLHKLRGWIGGHPYLVRQALYAVATGLYTPERFINLISHKDGPFGDHLKQHLLNLLQNPELVKAMKRLLKSQAVPSDAVEYRLEGAGLVRVVNDVVFIRNNLYKVFFEEHLK